MLCEEKQTQPPARYTEGTLIAAMKSIGKHVTHPEHRKRLRENAGIGTEATRAGIIQTLLQRGLIKKQKRHLISTTSGQSLIALLPSDIKDPITTAIWEQALEDIATNKGDLAEFLKQQCQWLQAILRQARQQYEQTHSATKPCPECGKPMYSRSGKNGPFWGCSDYPNCRATLPSEQPETKPSGSCGK